MKTFCQTIFNSSIPASVKSILTKELIETHRLTQEKVAEKLGITQAAVSQYRNGVRGKRVNAILSNTKLAGWIKNLAAEIASGNFRLADAECGLCADMKKEMKDEELGSLICLIEMYNLRGKE